MSLFDNENSHILIKKKSKIQTQADYIFAVVILVIHHFLEEKTANN